jgi:hypothetical protein
VDKNPSDCAERALPRGVSATAKDKDATASI